MIRKKLLRLEHSKTLLGKLFEKSGCYDRQTGTTSTNNAPRLAVASQVFKSLCLQTKKLEKFFPLECFFSSNNLCLLLTLAR